MKIAESIHQSIIDDIDFALSKMETTDNKGDLLFYFSAFFGAIHRALNFEYDEDLVFAHLVLKATYEALFGRLKVFSSGNDQSVPLFEEHFSSLVKLAKAFREKAANNKNADSILKKMAILAYSTTGNGHYLFSKGWLKIKGDKL
jgi:hypothetical protein